MSYPYRYPDPELNFFRILPPAPTPPETSETTVIQGLPEVRDRSYRTLGEVLPALIARLAGAQ